VAALLAIVGSVGIHAGLIVGGTFWGRARAPGLNHEEVKIELRQKPEPPPEKKPAPPEPVERPTRSPPKVVKAPPPAPPPVSAPKAKPVRVVGLSLESMTGGDGQGPAFAAGNTRMGQTAERAAAPNDLNGAPDGHSKAAPESGTGKNQVASHIPVAGVKYVPPKRKRPKEPTYPPTLKSQGIEGDVMVLVSLDATGKVLDVKILKGSPYPEFDEAARTAALAEEFEPAMRDDVPMPYTLSYTYRFRLEDK
jgi:TonB family protein